MSPRLRFFVLVLAALVSLAAAQAPPSPEGHWSGAIELPGQKLEVQVALAPNGGAWTGDIDIPAQGAKDLPLEKIAVDGSKIGFAIAGVAGAPTFAGVIAADGASIAGDFTQGGQTFPFALHRAAAVSFDGVQQWLDEVREKFHVPGCAVAVVHGGEIAAEFASGLRDVEKKLPVTADTLFAIGSSTKAFTTLLLGTLVDEGRLAWDEPVRTWIPEFALADAEVGERLTPRDLVTHRSGMPRHDLVWYGAKFERADMVRRLRHLPLSKDLRTDFQYNNLMFLTAGHLAERVAGASWEELVARRIFAPLGMTRSNFEVARSAADADHAEPYRRDGADTKHIAFRDITAIGPAGSINSSVREMARWVALHLQGGRHGDAQVVQPATMEDLHAVRMTMPGGRTIPEIVRVGYALGWMVDVYRGGRRIHHGGNIDGFSAMVAFAPDRDYGFVVLTNLDSTPLCELVSRRLCDRVFGLDDRDWASEALKASERSETEGEKGRANEASERKTGTHPSHDLGDYVGDYAHPGYGACRVTRDGEALHIDFHGIGAALEHWHYDVFRTRKDAGNPEIEGTKVQFTTDLDGDIDGLRAVLEPATEAIVFARQPDAQLRDAAFLKTLAGDYDLGGQMATFAVQGSALTVTLPGQHYVLAPRRSLVFAIGDMPGFSVRFVLDADGHPASCMFRQPDGVHEARRAPAK